MLILNVALPVPLRRCFDYAVDNDFHEIALSPGMRVCVPFGKSRKMVGMLTGTADNTPVKATRLKRITSLVDSSPVLSPPDLQLLQWAADYYHHPLGEVIFTTLPALLKQEKPLVSRKFSRWSLSEDGKALDSTSLKRAPKQKALTELLAAHPAGLTAAEIERNVLNACEPLQALHKKGLVVKSELPSLETIMQVETSPVRLNDEQKQASRAVISSLGSSGVFLLDGITGSGKTEVYINVMQSVIDKGKQVLVLSPEIGLTPQLVNRIASRISARIVVLHSGLSNTERLHAWMDARNGNADIIIGTRSAIWTPLKSPGLIIVDEEHDLSYKQQDGLRYSARDVAIMRGKLSNVPVVLGSATPAMESLQNVELGKFRSLRLDSRACEARTPQVRIIDLRHQAMYGAVSRVLLDAIDKELSNNYQVMLFLNRRGYAPGIMCHQCGWLADCTRCNVRMTYHKRRNLLACHHCDRQSPLPDSCPDCNATELLEIGHGTERLTETLTAHFPQARILRIDRDSTRRKGSMESMLDSINDGEADILVGTQMLAKGHHFPRLSLVGIIDADGGLCSTDFRASERMAQLFVQVGGRAGRASIVGMVMIQTHFPDHPLLNTLIEKGYRGFATELLAERQQANLPPFTYLALLRAESLDDSAPRQFLANAASVLEDPQKQLEVFGPFPAPMEKRAGKTRMQLMILSGRRGYLQKVLQSWCVCLENLPAARKVRWSLDIDPQDMM